MDAILDMGGHQGKFEVQKSRPTSGPKYTYKISVKTGDRPKAGTDANVYIVLHGNGQRSPETKLDAFFRNDFERGQLDVFRVCNIPVSISWF